MRVLKTKFWLVNHSENVNEEGESRDGRMRKMSYSVGLYHDNLLVLVLDWANFWPNLISGPISTEPPFRHFRNSLKINFQAFH